MTRERHDADALRALGDDLARRGCVPRTLVRFKQTAQHFLAFAGRRLAEIVKADVEAFLAARAAKGWKLVSRKATLVHLRALFRAAVEAKLVPRDATEGLSIRKVPHQEQLFLGREALEGLFAAASDVHRTARTATRRDLGFALRTRALVELLYGVGLRSEEAGRVLVSDLNLADGSIVVRPAKRGQPRTLPLPRAALPHLERYLREGRPLLDWKDGRDRGHLLLSRTGRPLTAGNVQAVVRLLAKRSGIRATSHAFRRTTATDMARAGISLEAVRQILGHSRLSTTAIYVDVDREDRRRAVDRLEALVHPGAPALAKAK